MYVQAMWGRSLVVGGVVISTWGGGGICWYVALTNNNHPPIIGCLPAGKRVMALARWLAEVGEQDYTKIQNETQNLPPSTNSDKWIVMEEPRPRRRQIIMQQWSSGKVVEFWLRKQCNNLCWNWLTVLMACHNPPQGTKQQYSNWWNYKSVAPCNNWQGTKWYVYGFVWLFFLRRATTIDVEIHKLINGRIDTSHAIMWGDDVSCSQQHEGKITTDNK